MNLGMGMGMHLSLNLRLEQKLELRQRLEQRLEQKLELQQKHEIKLGQYLIQEDFMTGLLNYAASHDCYRRFDKDGFDFLYAAVPRKVAGPVVDKTGPGFAHCFFNPWKGMKKGDWTVFVVPEMIPEGLEDFVALHERGEELSNGNHYFASQLEFAYVAQKRKICDYSEFIDANYPSKFIDLTQEVHFPILPEELKESLREIAPRNVTETALAEQMIEKHPIPTSILRKMVKYDDAVKRVQKAIDDSVGRTQQQTWKQYGKPKAAYLVADIIDERLSKILKKVKPSEAKAIARHIDLTDYTKTVLHGVYDQTHRHVVIEQDFSTAYDLVQKGERIASV